jgi:hypothetical protein
MLWEIRWPCKRTKTEENLATHEAATLMKEGLKREPAYTEHEYKGRVPSSELYTRGRNTKAKDSKDHVMEGECTWLRALYPWRLMIK